MVADAEGDDTVVVYSGRTEDLIKPILDRFADETGVDVEVRYGNTSDLALLIEEEGDQSPADVLPVAVAGCRRLPRSTGPARHAPENALALVPRGSTPATAAGSACPVVDRVLAFNPQIVPEDELPASVLDLTGEESSGRIGIAPSNASFQDFVSAMRIELGDETTSEWLEGIAANDPVTFANNNAIVAAIGRGEIDVGLVNHYYVYQALAEDPDYPGRHHNFAPDDIGGSSSSSPPHRRWPTPSTPMPPKRSSSSSSVRRRSATSPTETFEYPLADGVEPAEVLPDVDLAAASAIEEPDFDDLGTDLDRPSEMIRDAGLEG